MTPAEQLPFDFVPLDCAKLARAMRKSRWYVSRMKSQAKGMPDDPFHGGREATLRDFTEWRKAHPELNTNTKPSS